MATEAKQTVHTGNTVYFMIGKDVIARAQSLQSERSFGTTGIYEIGTIMPKEHVYLKYEGSVTVDRFRMRKENLISLGYAALGEDVLKLDVVDIVLQDDTTKQVIEAYFGCSIDTYNTEVRTNEVATENSRWLFLSAGTTVQ